MSTAGGPKLYGIGRGGDSDIVLCMDAHDAGSYPGEPTYNVMANPLPLSGWTVSNHLGSTATVTYASEDGVPHMEISDVAISTSDYPRINMAALLNTITDNFSISFEAKCNIDGTNLSIALYSGGSTKTTQAATLTPEWKRYTFENITTGFTLDDGYLRPNETVTGAIRYIRRIQIEQKTYSTPFVGAQHNNPMLRGPSARPASVNLSLNDGSFNDKSPNKLALTNTSTTMPGFGGKFGGAAYYFNASSYLTYAIPSGSSALFGTGNYTIDFWHYMPAGTSLKQYATWFSTYTSGYNSGIIIAQHVTSGTYGVWNGSWLNTGVTILTDQWAHVAIVREGTGTNESTYYLNGTSIMTFTSSFDFVTATIKEFMVGSLYAANHNYGLEGYMSDVRVCSGTALWTAAFTPPTRRNDNGPLVDLSGYNNVTNFATKATTDVTNYRDGQVLLPTPSAYWDFDGTDDYMRGAQPTGQVGSTTAKTYEYWFKMKPSWAASNLSMGTADANNYKWQYVYVGTNGYLQFLYGDNSGYNIYGGSATQVVGSANVWTCVAISIDISRAYDDRLKIYKNGEPITVSWNTGGSYPRTDFYDGTDLRLYIGCQNYATPVNIQIPFDGEIAKVSIWKTGLTHQQVKQNFNSQRSRFKV